MTRRELDGAGGQASSLVDPAEPQSGPAQRVVGPGEMRDDIRRREAFGDLLAQLDLLQRLARFAELRQRPGRGGERAGKLNGDVSRSEHREAVLAHRARPCPVSLV